MSDQPDAQTSTWQHTTLTRDRHPCPRRDSNPQFQPASGRRPTPRGHWHRQSVKIVRLIQSNILQILNICGNYVTKSKLSLKPCRIKLYLSRSKMKLDHLKYKILFKKYLIIFKKHNFFYWWFTLKINPALIMQKAGEKNKKIQLKIVKIIFTNIIIQRTWAAIAQSV